MSPEQGSGEAYVDGRSDIYSLGCVLYEMLAGHAPFTGASVQEILARHSLDPVPSLRAARPGTPEALEQVVVKALAKAPADRFATAAEFARALSAGSIPRPVRLRGARRWAAASLGLLGTGFVLIAVVLVVFLVKGRPWAAPVAAAHHTQLTFEGNVINAEISPDGELLGYISEVG
jgi:serine/threonine-protein kinase